MRIFYIILFIVYSTNALALVKFTSEELKNIAVHFLNAKNRLQQPKPSDNDIKNFLDVLASDLKVEYISRNRACKIRQRWFTPKGTYTNPK